MVIGEYCWCAVCFEQWSNAIHDARFALLALTYVGSPTFSPQEPLKIICSFYFLRQRPCRIRRSPRHAVSGSQSKHGLHPTSNSRGRDRARNAMATAFAFAACRPNSRREPSALFLVCKSRDPRPYSVSQNLHYLLHFAAFFAQA